MILWLGKVCGYTKQPKNSFWCHVIDTKGAVLLLLFMNKFVLFLDLSFSFRYLVVLKLLQNLKNEAACNHFHSILRFFDVLPNFLFTTSEKKRDY